jgi:hypothetical protein
MSSLVTFTNPVTAASYAWAANPNSENAGVKQRAIERTSNTGNAGVVKQQGDDGPLILDWQVIVQTAAMETALWQWWQTSKVHTIYLTDWDGEEYEGQIILLSRQRIPSGGPRTEYATYEMQFEVYRFISGVLATAGVTP